MKKLLSMLLVFCMMAVFTTGCTAQTQATGGALQTITLQIGNPMMTVDGGQQEVDPGRATAPVIEGERTLLPVRAVVEAMGGAVAWDEETQTTVLAKGDAVILLTIGSSAVFLNETAHILDTAPVIINDRTMLPIRFIAEGFGYEVGWDGETSTVTLTGTAAEETAQSAGAGVEMAVEDNMVTVSNAPAGSMLITAFYRDNALSDVKLYPGSGTITADISQGMASADVAKIFLWDMETLQPLTETMEATMTNKIFIAVNGHTLTATLADNSSAQALVELLREAPITIEMQDYGNFEKVGGLGATLPRNDEQITTQAGDLILYQGNQITIYYDTNSWNFTRLGKIDDITQSELKEILGAESVTVTFSLYSASQEAHPGNFNFETRTVLLNSGYEMPINGLGTYSLHGETCVNSVKSALASGVRLIDTASAYGNEEEVGQAIRESMEELGIEREEIFVITKIYPGSEMANPEESIQACLDRLDIGYVDMMLLHHPDENDVQAYKAMERFVAEGKIRSIGLSNWYVEELEEFLPQVDTIPALVQNEIHPYYQENDVIPYIQDLGITVQGWYPLGGRGHTAELLGDPVISEIAQAHGVSSAQVILRWNLQKGVVVIPGSSNPDHIKENTELHHFSLTDEEMQRINALDRGEKHDWY